VSQCAPRAPAALFDIVASSLACGLVAGAGELALLLVNRPIKDSAPLFFRANRHVVWSVPLVNALLFLAAGLLLHLARPVWTSRRPRLAAEVFACGTLCAWLLAIPALHTAAALVLAVGAALKLGGFAASRAVHLKKARFAVIVTLAMATGAAAAATLGRDRSELPRTSVGATDGPPNVLLIVLDTVRSDHMSTYGYHRETTPLLSRWFASETRFNRAYSTAPWTLPSHASLFTGLWPHQHRAGLHRPLDNGSPTVAEALRQRGFNTAGFVANTIYCSAESGLARGFTHYEDHDLGPRSLLRTTALGRTVVDKAVGAGIDTLAAFRGGQASSAAGRKHFKSAERLNADTLAWLDRQPRDAPFFIFLNYFDAHHPYVVPVAHPKRFGAVPKDRAEALLLHRWWDLDKSQLNPRSLELAVDGYDDCLHYLDTQLGRLFRALQSRGLWDSTLVIVTSDHGEHFGEHELYGHAGSLYTPEVAVPLLVHWPGSQQAPLVVDAPVSNRDIAATIADAARVPATFPGHSLGRFKSLHAAPQDPILTQVEGPSAGPANAGRSPAFRGAMASIVRDNLAYIRNADGREELFDLATDPLQTRNLVGSAHSAESALGELRATLDTLLQLGGAPEHARSLNISRGEAHAR
jgi:arylsulfatase A-like enzyme